MRDAFIRTLCELAQNDPKIFLITGDLGFKVLDDYRSRFPRQFLNAGIAEQNMTGLATGLALEGRTVFTYSIANFPFMRCLEQIRSDACYHQADVKIVSIGAGFSYGQLGISHHATEDVSIMRTLPGVTMMSPCTDEEASVATRHLATTPGVGYLRLDRQGAALPPSSASASEVRPGELRQILPGDEIVFIATGGIVVEALAAAKLLADRGLSCGVYSAHTLKPFDRSGLLTAVSGARAVITVEEHSIEGGLGGIVAEILLEATVRPELFHRIGLRSEFSSVVGDQSYLRKVYRLDADAIAAAAAELIERGGAAR